MPPTPSRQRGTLRRLRWFALAFVVVVGAVVWLALSLGRVLYHEDPLEQADAIFVLGGNWLARVVEAGDLYVAGRAPLIVLSREVVDAGEDELRARGITVPGVADIQMQALEAMGVPRTALYVIEPQEATATEAETLRDLAARHGWRSVIVVTARLHTARARFVMRKYLDPINVRIVMRATRYDHSDVDHWWRDRVTFRFAIFEAQKMLSYWIGVAD